jgi:hypothetical protein
MEERLAHPRVLLVITRCVAALADIRGQRIQKIALEGVADIRIYRTIFTEWKRKLWKLTPCFRITPSILMAPFAILRGNSR